MRARSCAIAPWSWPQSEWTAGRRLRPSCTKKAIARACRRKRSPQALRYLYDCRPALSLRAIGAKPEVGLHHDTVGKIRDAAAAALGVGAGGPRQNELCQQHQSGELRETGAALMFPSLCYATISSTILCIISCDMRCAGWLPRGRSPLRQNRLAAAVASCQRAAVAFCVTTAVRGDLARDGLLG